MKSLTPSVYTFEKLIQGDFIYVDKTEFLWKLVQPSTGIYFLSRPRRFGKSLTLSTLKAIFQGKRDLFKGLAIYDKPYDWEDYPIIHLNFADCVAENAETLLNYLAAQLSFACQDAGISVKIDASQPGISFEAIIRALAVRKQVVILVDEYDKPLLNNLGDPNVVWNLLPVMKGFYAAIKKCEDLERFVFVTGVTKFCHVSLFSDLNNLQDISTDMRFATLLGYTQEELEGAFSEHLAQVEASLAVGHAELLQSLKSWYDGYRFAPNAETVYNPVSVANFFIRGGSFENYWFATGTTSSLFRLMRQDGITLPGLMEQPVRGDLFDSFELSSVDVQKLMYQTGYLTIGETRAFSLPDMPGVKQFSYHLRFPNYEVKSSFNDQVLEHYAGLKSAQSLDVIRRLVADVKSGDADAFMNRLKVLFARIPYNLHGHEEHDYQSVLYVIFMMVNVAVAGEYHTNEGRIDLVLSAEAWTYVIELKLNHSAEEAMRQIEHKDYARGFLGQGRRVVAVGVNFDETRAQIDNWLTEEL